jgi:protein gp37
VGDTSIEWTDKTWNPVRGCSRVSPGCENCYAERVAARFSGPGMAYEGLATPKGWTRKVRLVPEHLADPVRWRRRSLRVFVNSMSDLFHEALSFEDIDQVFGVMAACRYYAAHGDVFEGHTFQVLTKRAERMRAYLSEDRRDQWADAAVRWAGGTDPDGIHDQTRFGPQALPHVWLGVSVEDQRRADERIPHLLATPAAVRFLSCEPLLGPVDLWHMDEDAGAMRGPAVVRSGGMTSSTAHGPPEGYDDSYPGIDWVIVGGESGGGARPFDLAWARSLVAQCRAASVACFVKQLGAVPVMDEAAWRGTVADPLLALSVQHPWALALALGIKDVENRDWRYPPPARLVGSASRSTRRRR